MNLFDNFILNMLHIMLPIMVYTFYIAYRNASDKRENDLAFIIMIFSLLYIILKYNVPIVIGLPMIMINIPLIITYLKKDYLSITITSLIIAVYNYTFYNNFLLIIILEYTFYLLIYIFIFKNNKNVFIIAFSIIKTIFMIGALVLINYQTFDKYIGAITLGLCFCLIMITILYLNEKTKEILKIHKSIKEIIRDKEVRTSLFKITHEIKNPIAVCKGYLDMFDINDISNSKKYIPIIKQEINKILILLEDFLAINKMKINKEILDINMLLNDVLKNYEIYFKKHKINLINKITDDELYIYGDYNRLNQVFVNIIKNGIEALKNKKNIEVWTKIKNKKIHIYFKDSGIGINKKTIKKIKEPFFTTKNNGNGLGVALSNEIIKAHNGTLNYSSKEGEYTKVIITLPTIKIE